MVSTTLLISYAILLMFQILHVFEEIGMDVYKLKAVGSRKKYLRVASVIMVIYNISYLLIVLNMPLGIWLGILCSAVACGNLLIHSIGYLKVRNFRGTIAAGVFSSIPLGIVGVANLILLFSEL